MVGMGWEGMVSPNGGIAGGVDAMACMGWQETNARHGRSAVHAAGALQSTGARRHKAFLSSYGNGRNWHNGRGF